MTTQNKAALVIGNSAYLGRNALQNPVNDAADIAAKLESYGFQVVVATDASGLEMDQKLAEFAALLESTDVGFFFFAGHGVQVDGVNYLLAVDSKTVSALEAKHSSLSLDRVIELMAASKTSTRIIVLDACRNNPWDRQWKRSLSVRGLAPVHAPKGTIIAYATSPGEEALDGVGRNGTYTAALLQHIDTPDCSIESMLKRVRNTVAAQTKGKQTSWEHTSLSGEFYFKLSLSNLVTEYRDSSLADSLLVLDESKASHRIIRELSAHDWYRQNAALNTFNVAAAAKISRDSLFVIGRNVYQAACGGSHGAEAFIARFPELTSGLQDGRRKALLDGMLFEVFFDSKGKLREKIKGRRFDEVFDLQQHEELTDSFAFIAATLAVAGGRFYVLPGKNLDLAVTLATRTEVEGIRVEHVYVDGADVLQVEDQDLAAPVPERVYLAREPHVIAKQLSEELCVPLRSLNLTYTPPGADKAKRLGFPEGYTVRRA